MHDSRPSRNVVARAQPWLGTFVEIRAECARRSRWQLMSSLDAAFAEVEIIHRLMSRQERGKDVARLGSAAVGESVPVDFRTCEVLRLAQALREESGGLFDPERPEGVEAGLDADRVRPAWAFDDSCAVRILRRITPDLDGIAKGYAVDRAIAILESAGIAATVNAGGDLRTTGESLEPLLVRCPLAPGGLLKLGRLGQGAFATSRSRHMASHGQDLAGEGVEDRRQPNATLPPVTVCVAAPSCAIADALTKIVAVDPDHAEALLGARGASAWTLQERAGELHMRRHGASCQVTLDAA